jgi:hypothetical protein
MNECLIEIIMILGIEKTFSIEISKKMYKGFIEYDENNIFIVFEYLPLTALCESTLLPLLERSERSICLPEFSSLPSTIPLFLELKEESEAGEVDSS